MPERTSTRPRDTNRLAKLVVELATDKLRKTEDSAKNPAAVALGRLGGKKGGKARARALSAAQRREIAQLAASARWAKNQKKS